MAPDETEQHENQDTAESDDLDACDGYVVLISDHETGDRDAYGPLSLAGAVSDAHEREREFHDEGLAGLEIDIVRQHDPRNGRDG